MRLGRPALDRDPADRLLAAELAEGEGGAGDDEAAVAVGLGRAAGGNGPRFGELALVIPEFELHLRRVASIGDCVEARVEQEAAIAVAADPGDVVLLLGQGPLLRLVTTEDGDEVPFDDREVLREALRGSRLSLSRP